MFAIFTFHEELPYFVLKDFLRDIFHNVFLEPKKLTAITQRFIMLSSLLKTIKKQKFVGKYYGKL